MRPERHTDRVRFLCIAAVAVLASLALAAPAAAQEEGVFIDPGSPSAKEYQIPLESERRQADPEQDPSAEIVQGARSSPLFGAGIVRGDGGNGATGGDDPSGAEQDEAEARRARTSSRRA